MSALPAALRFAGGHQPIEYFVVLWDVDDQVLPQAKVFRDRGRAEAEQRRHQGARIAEAVR